MTTARLKIANPHDPLLAASVQRTLDRKTKPQGSLGRLDGLALQLALIQGREQPLLASPQLVVFAAYPSDVTWQMVENFLASGAAVAVLARQHGLALTVVDCGVRHGVGAWMPVAASRVGFPRCALPAQPVCPTRRQHRIEGVRRWPVADRKARTLKAGMAPSCTSAWTPAAIRRSPLTPTRLRW